MATAKIHLQKLIQDSQDLGSDDEHMISRVFFDLEIEGTKYEGLYCDVKQSVGSSFESSPLEVSTPPNFKGSFNYDAFRSIIEQYYRGLIGASGRGIHISGGSNIRMRNNTFVYPTVAEFDVQVAGGPW